VPRWCKPNLSKLILPISNGRLFRLTSLCFISVSILLLSASGSSEASPEIFTDVTQQAGIHWQQFSGESPDRFLIETMGGGVAFLDFDGDGLQDIFFVNGGETPHGKSSAPVRNALYRNLGNGKFEEVAAKAGVDRVAFYGMGVSAADYDNDGFQDLYITGFPASALFHNNGNGTFTDVTDKTGVKNAGRWGASAAWFDYDRDGLLDLVVTNYAQLSFDNPKKCELSGVRSYCAQVAYQGEPLTLYHTNGNGSFSDVSARSGLDKFIGRALGVVSIDLNEDGFSDLFIARDGSPNLLLINQKNGTFKDMAVEAEIAYDSNGLAKAGMGVDAGDVNGDGIPDFVVTNFNDQYHSLFVGSQPLPYEDHTVASHLAQYSRADVGWGAKFIDYNNDGYLDLVIANGHVNSAIELTRADVKYQELPLLLRNDGKGIFQNLAAEAGAAFNSGQSGRGLAVGDFNNDGTADVVFTTLNGPPILLRNNSGKDNDWIGFELRGTASNRDAIGAKITVSSGGRRMVRWITSGSSYLASHDKRVLVGLGKTLAGATVDAEIRWPSGTVQKLSKLEANRYHPVTEPAPPSLANLSR
jgi:enediyne biosynthesis protein E4